MYSKYFKAWTDEAQVYGVKGEAAEVGMIARRYIDMDIVIDLDLYISIYTGTHICIPRSGIYHLFGIQ